MVSRSKASIVVVLIVFSGCATTTFYNKSYQVGIPIEVTVGSTMIAWEIETKDEAHRVVSSFTRELLYSGIDDNTVHISYREFADAYARPAFQQDLIYDISKSKTITFRDVILEVESVDQARIAFTVIAEPAIMRTPHFPEKPDGSIYRIRLTGGESLRGKIVAVGSDWIRFSPIGSTGDPLELQKREIRSIEKE